MLEDCDGFLNGADMVDGETPLAALFPDATPTRIFLKILEETSEHRTLIVGYIGVIDEIDIHDVLFQRHFFDSELSGKAPEARNAQEFGRYMRNLSEAVDQPLLEFEQVFLALYRIEFLIKRYAFTLLRYVVGRQQQFEIALYYAVGDIFGVFALSILVGIKLAEFFVAKLGDRLFQDLLIGLVAQIGDESALLGTEQIAGSADVEVLHCDVDSAPEIGKLSIACKRRRDVGESGT